MSTRLRRFCANRAGRNHRHPVVAVALTLPNWYDLGAGSAIMLLAMHDPLSRIYRLKVTLISVITTVTGLALLVFAKFVESDPSFAWLRNFPVFELGSTLFITGSLVIVWDYVDGRDKEAREDERIRRLLKDSASDFRDAVLEGFALEPEDLERVATPELLDQLAENALALRFGDAAFAREVYTDLRTQVITAAERWYDVQVSVRLSDAEERDTAGDPLFDALITWEYSTTPSHPMRRFACVSDRDDYYELTSDLPSTSAWLMSARSGMDASDRANFELLDFAVDGESRRIRRTVSKSGQTYGADIGRDLVAAHTQVRIRHTYRVRTPQSGHRLFFEIVQPSRGVSVDVDYTDTQIARLSVTELVSSSHKPSVTRLPEATGARQVSIETAGWLLPRAGFAFVWTLSAEQAPAAHAPASTPAASTTHASNRSEPSLHRS